MKGILKSKARINTKLRVQLCTCERSKHWIRREVFLVFCCVMEVLNFACGTGRRMDTRVRDVPEHSFRSKTRAGECIFGQFSCFTLWDDTRPHTLKEIKLRVLPPVSLDSLVPPSIFLKHNIGLTLIRVDSNPISLPQFILGEISLLNRIVGWSLIRIKLKIKYVATRLLQLTGRWQYDGIMWSALRSVKSYNVDFLNQIRYFSIK